MQNQLVEAFVGIFTAIIGVAIIAVLVSQKSNTTGVLQAWGSAFSNALGVAVSPVTGSTVNINTSYPGGSSALGNFSNFNGFGIGAG